MTMNLKKNNSEIDSIKSKINDLASFHTKDEKYEFKTDVLQVNIIQQIQELMDQKGLKKKDLAEYLNVSKSRITQLFSGDKRINLKTIVQFSDLFDAIPEIKIINKAKATKIHYPSSKNLIDWDDALNDFEKYYTQLSHPGNNNESKFKEMKVSYRNPEK